MFDATFFHFTFSCKITLNWPIRWSHTILHKNYGISSSGYHSQKIWTYVYPQFQTLEYRQKVSSSWLLTERSKLFLFKSKQKWTFIEASVNVHLEFLQVLQLLQLMLLLLFLSCLVIMILMLYLYYLLIMQLMQLLCISCLLWLLTWCHQFFTIQLL